MKYEQKSFTVPASGGDVAYCTEHGHTQPDIRGRCLRCGTRTLLPPTATPCHDFTPDTT